MKFFIGMVIGGVLSIIVWFPMGIMYTVQAADNSMLVKIVAVIKGVFGV